MKVTVFKKKGTRETVVRMEMGTIIEAITSGKYAREVYRLREFYHLLRPHWTEDGQMKTGIDFRLTLPRICFAAETDKYRKQHRILNYNGLIVLEANNLADYDEAILIRDEAARMPQTLLACLGASGRSVKIVCRGELYPDQATPSGGHTRAAKTLPTDEADIERFHQALYQVARKAYNAQLDITLDAVNPLIHRTIYMTADPNATYREQAVPFYVDIKEQAAPAPHHTGAGDDKERSLMPGRSLKQTYILNYQFILTDVLGHYFDLPDEERTGELLMQVAAKCLEEGIPQQQAMNLTMCHPLFNTDHLLVEKTFENVYAVRNMEDYKKRNPATSRLKPLKSVPEDAMMMMKTDIFLHTHYEMRKNIMTGVAQYRERNGEDDDFRDLDEEARNEMTMRAKELGLKTWDKDIARFIESPRIDKFDPVNTWLDSLRPWDGIDRVGPLAQRVPTSQPHWEEYLHTWLLGMVAHWQGKRSLTGNALVPLIIGRQGCGKSSFCRILLPRELRDYYNDRINFKNETDLNLGLTSFALINIDEFDKTTARQQVLLKYLLSTADVKFRPPYGKAYRQYRRYASFIGTTNQPKPLTDPTGSRRFVCVEVTDMIDFEDSIDHYQLYAQLKAEIEQGARYWLNDEEIARLIEENERFQRIDSLEEMVATLFRRPEPDEDGTWYSASEVLEKLQARFGKTSLKGVNPEKIGNCLGSRRFNFTSGHKHKGNCYLMAEA